MPDINVCAIDWTRPAYYEYDAAANRFTYEVGQYIADIFKKWNLNLDLVSLVGHSMGAQVAGHAGKLLNGKLGKIFGKLIGDLFCHVRRFYVN